MDCKCNFAIIIRSLFCMQITIFMVFWIYLFGLFEFWTWVAFENVVNLFCGYVLTQIISPFILWKKRAINQLANQCDSRKKATVQSIHCTVTAIYKLIHNLATPLPTKHITIYCYLIRKQTYKQSIIHQCQLIWSVFFTKREILRKRNKINTQNNYNFMPFNFLLDLFMIILL